MNNEIFYPNKLKASEIDSLGGWKLKIATLHFVRMDCARFGYGYRMMKSDVFAKEQSIHVVADNDGIWENPIDLADEIDWDDVGVLLEEAGYNSDILLKNRIKEKLDENRN